MQKWEKYMTFKTAEQEWIERVGEKDAVCVSTIGDARVRP